MYQFTHWAVAVPGVVAVLPGAVAPERAPRLQGACPGPGRRRLRREEPTAPAEATGALVDESPGVGDGQVTWIRGRCGGPGPRDHRRRGAFAPRVACSRAPAAPRCPVRVLVAQPTMRPSRTGPVTKAVQRGTPCRVGTWVKSTTQRRSAPGGGGSRGGRGPSGDRVPLGGPGGAHRPARPGAGQSQCPHAPLHGAPGHPGALLPGARQPPGLLGSQRRIERLFPQGEDPLVQGGVRDRPLRRRAGPGGVSQVDGAGPATLTRSGRCRSAQAPQLLPCARRCSRRSAGRALTLRRHDKPTRSSGSRPPAPGSRTSFSNSPVRRAPSVVVPGRSPASIRA